MLSLAIEHANDPTQLFSPIDDVIFSQLNLPRQEPHPCRRAREYDTLRYESQTQNKQASIELTIVLAFAF